MNELTAQRLRELLHYDPETGLLTRKTTRGGQPTGAIAGNVCTDGRVQVYIDGRNFKAHRLIWLWVTGQWPVNDVDHKDGIPSNNRWANLRDVPHAVNLQNRQRAPKHSSTGLLGVTKNRGGFGAQIKINGKRVWLGTFDTPEEAHRVAIDHKRIHHKGNTL